MGKNSQFYFRVYQEVLDELERSVSEVCAKTPRMSVDVHDAGRAAILAFARAPVAVRVGWLKAYGSYFLDQASIPVGTAEDAAEDDAAADAQDAGREHRGTRKKTKKGGRKYG